MRQNFSKFGLIAVAILAVGAVATASWFAFRHYRPAKAKLMFGPPCRDGLVSIEPQADAPMRITISNAGCDNPQSASIQFLAENISASPISEFEVRAIETYDELIDQGSGVTSMGAVLDPRQTRIGFIGGGVMTAAGGKPVGPLKSYQLTVWSVRFTDGRTWTRRLAS